MRSSVCCPPQQKPYNNKKYFRVLKTFPLQLTPDKKKKNKDGGEDWEGEVEEEEDEWEDGKDEI